MPKVEKLLLSCSTARSSTHTSRKLISFKRHDHYGKCLNQLANFGIKPLKSIRRGRVIVCHVDSRRADKLQTLAHHPDVNYVEPDFKVHAHGFVRGIRREGRRRADTNPQPQTLVALRERTLRPKTHKASVRSESTSSSAPWNVKQVQAHSVWSASRGGGVGIGIIDTGIGKHPDLYVSGGVNTMGGSSYADDNGHGTIRGHRGRARQERHAAGHRADAKLYAVKALDASGAGYVSDLIKGIEWCIKKKIPVINMSLGLEGETSSALKEAVQRARKKGIVVVASAGNSGPSNTAASTSRAEVLIPLP